MTKRFFISAISILLIFSCAQQRPMVSKKTKPSKTSTTQKEVYSDNPDIAVFQRAINEYNQQRYDDAFSTIKQLNVDSLDAEFKLRVVWFLGNLQFETGNRQKAVEAFITVYGFTQDEAMRSKVTMSILASMDKMDINELKNLQDKHEEWKPYVIFKLGEKYMQQGQEGASKDKFRTFINDYPQHEYVTQAQSYITRMDSLEKVDPNTIGVILPLTGKNAAYGLKSLMGIQLAFSVFGDNKNSKTGIRLAVMDSQDDPEVAKIAVDRLIEEDNVIAIIGTLGVDSAEVVAKQCSMAGIPNVTLSQKEDLEGIGKYVFRVAMTNRNQIKRLVSYAMDELSMKRFGILYPSDNYGQELSKYFWNEVLSKDGEITAVESYEVKQDDFRDEVKKLLGTYYIGARRTEYVELKKQLDEESKNAVSKKKGKEINLPPILSFDALFIPDDARAVAQIAPYLPYYDARNVILLGPNTWNSSQLVSRGGQNVEGAVFVDGFSSSPASEEGKAFIRNFKTAFNTTPGVLEAQAYDAANILMNVLKSGNVTRDSVRSSIEKMGTYVGATGKISFGSDGDVSKELFVLGVERGKIVLKD